jgi:hypothetical protein
MTQLTLLSLLLPWTRLHRVTTDEALSMMGKKTGLMGRIRREMDKQNHKFYMKFHCTIHKQLLCGETSGEV